MTRRELVLLGAQAATFLVAVAIGAATTQASDWEPFGLFAVLAAGTIVSGLYPIEIRGVRAAGCSIGIILAAALLGPAPAAVVGVLSQIAMSARRRPPLQTTVCNVMVFTVFPLAAGFLIRFAGDLGLTHGDFGLPATVFAAFLAANFLNFLLLELDLML